MRDAMTGQFLKGGAAVLDAPADAEAPPAPSAKGVRYNNPDIPWETIREPMTNRRTDPATLRSIQFTNGSFWATEKWQHELLGRLPHVFPDDSPIEFACTVTGCGFTCRSSVAFARHVAKHL